MEKTRGFRSRLELEDYILKALELGGTNGQGFVMVRDDDIREWMDGDLAKFADDNALRCSWMGLGERWVFRSTKRAEGKPCGW
jgi:hypothetical protein